MCRMVYTEFCHKFQSDLVPSSCRVLVKTVENSGFWVSFDPGPETTKDTSPGNATKLDVAVVISRLEVPSKSDLKFVLLNLLNLYI
jgi:hypothetical protein